MHQTLTIVTLFYVLLLPASQEERKNKKFNSESQVFMSNLTLRSYNQ